MDQLSSCYFCGAALDATLDEHPVVPASLHPGTDTQKTVVLCGTCKRKLDAVLDQVVGAVEARADESLDGGDRTDANPDDGSADIEATLGDDADVLRSVGDGEESGDSQDGVDAAAEASGMQFGDDRAQSDDEDDGDQPTGGQRDDSDGTEPKKRKYTESRRAGYTGDDDGDDQADDGSEDRSKDSVTMTRLESTKVMRLLQNREFPVERDGFVTVASSAYEISPGDCDKVLDLAIQHGLLREDDGQLQAGPEWG